MSNSDDWGGILDKGERIVWQGRPTSSVIWGDILRMDSAMGVFMVAFAIFWINVTGQMDNFGGMGNTRGGPPFPFTLFPLIGWGILAVALYNIVGRLFFDAWKRSRSFYTLTTLAAYTATDTFGKRSLDRVAIDKMDRLTLEDGTPGTIWFGERVTEHTSYNKGHRRRFSTRTPLGFRQIDSPRAVYALLRDLRAADAGD